MATVGVKGLNGNFRTKHMLHPSGWNVHSELLSRPNGIAVRYGRFRFIESELASVSCVISRFCGIIYCIIDSGFVLLLW